MSHQPNYAMTTQAKANCQISIGSRIEENEVKRGIYEMELQNDILDQGCKGVYLRTKNPNFGIIWKALEKYFCNIS
jgi:hypothetical protein